MFKKGDQVELLPEFQDAGDDGFLWVVLEDEEKGRVDISPVNINLKIMPRFTVEACQIKLIDPSGEGLGAIADVRTLAQEFSASLRSLLTPEQMQSVILRNAAETDSNICHSHDFCDANVVMHEVFLVHGMDPADEGGMDRWGRLWDAAWNLAKDRGFDPD
jgi:hypothetical protein